jgi:CDP-diacylglycerol--glycerol-3-phosphate 3-phosphatidyltransferase
VRLADKFTLVRMFFAPVFFVCYRLSGYLAGKNETASLFVLVLLTAALIFAEFTDFLDGFYARKLGEVSDTGKLFDPFADALLHITTFFCFTLDGYMPPVAFILIFWREFGQIFLRMISIKGGFAIAARGGGKLKTVLYIASGFYVLALQILVKTELISEKPPFSQIAAVILFYLCVALSYISFIDYLLLFKAKMLKK